jgi:PKHD-type hydroxylase
MFLEIPDLLSAGEVAELLRLAASGTFADGRVSNPHSTIKRNEQLHDPAVAPRVAQIVTAALYRRAEFVEFAFPKIMAPPLLTRHSPGMYYGAHSDAAFIQVGKRSLRTDLSTTVFVSDPVDYDGGALAVRLGERVIEFRLPAGSAIVYPSTTLHEVTPVTRGERIVAITFIESRIPNAIQRDLVYELNEVAALEGLSMSEAGRARLQRARDCLLRLWSEPAD